jgi:hypothetical protein
MPANRRPNTTCLICKVLIYRRTYDLKRNKDNHAFCSMICYGQFYKKERPCIICRTLIPGKFNKKTCSRSCSNKNRVGIKYKTGRLKDKVVDLRALKLRLLNIRGNKCERCEYNKTEILHVHHKDKDRKNNDLGNLELICPNCHYEEHYLGKSWLARLNPETILGLRS